MQIKLTLVCKCCNLEMDKVHALRYLLFQRGHRVDVCSRNCHGREPKSMGLDIPFTSADIEKESAILLETDTNIRASGFVSTFVLPEGV